MHQIKSFHLDQLIDNGRLNVTKNLSFDGALKLQNNVQDIHKAKVPKLRNDGKVRIRIPQRKTFSTRRASKNFSCQGFEVQRQRILFKKIFQGLR